MFLKDIEMIQSVVVDIDDPEKQGRIKCVIPGMFESEQEMDGYPWISPIGMTRYQSFSKELKGAKVWVLYNPTNYNEFYYIPLFEKTQATSDFLDGVYDENPEIVFLRNNCGTISKITYDEINGTNIQVKDAYITITPNNIIKIHGNGNDIILENGTVKIGSSEAGDQQPAVLGKILQEFIGKLENAFSQGANSAAGDALSVKGAFQQLKQACTDYKGDKIVCKKTFVN